MQGLKNIGSTCAINSLVQMICRNDTLRDIIINYNLSDDTLTSNLKEILVSMHINNKSLIPRKFVKKIFETFQDIFTFGEQLDIYELWIFLYGKIIEEVNQEPSHFDIISNNKLIKDKIKKGIVYKNEKEFTYSLLNSNRLRDKFDYYNVKLNDNKTSKLQISTQGFFLNITKCSKCQNVLYNFESFTTLNLNIPNDNIPSIADMIMQNYKEELKYGDWKCDICNEMHEYNKSTKIWSLPDVLFVVINRFVNKDVKNNNPIYINENFCFKKGTILNDIGIDKRYYLSSIAMHIGCVDGGHYTAICDNNEGYYLYNDLHISKVDNFLENNTNVYMLIYNYKK
jgi:ubiquitin C-terminal hydrolase